MMVDQMVADEPATSVLWGNTARCCGHAEINWNYCVFVVSLNFMAIHDQNIAMTQDEGQINFSGLARWYKLTMETKMHESRRSE